MAELLYLKEREDAPSGSRYSFGIESISASVQSR